MAFDMYMGKTRDCIGHHEEFLLELARRTPDRYPGLSTLFDNLYADPVLQPDAANIITHELIELLPEAVQVHKSAERIILRLLPFFSSAYRQGIEIRCSSD